MKTSKVYWKGGNYLTLHPETLDFINIRRFLKASDLLCLVNLHPPLPPFHHHYLKEHLPVAVGKELA